MGDTEAGGWGSGAVAGLESSPPTRPRAVGVPCVGALRRKPVENKTEQHLLGYSERVWLIIFPRTPIFFNKKQKEIMRRFPWLICGEDDF